MTEYLKLIRENAYFKYCIINLIEELDKNKDLKLIQNYLKDVVEQVYPNTEKENVEKIFNLLGDKNGQE